MSGAKSKLRILAEIAENEYGFRVDEIKDGFSFYVPGIQNRLLQIKAGDCEDLSDSEILWFTSGVHNDDFDVVVYDGVDVEGNDDVIQDDLTPTKKELSGRIRYTDFYSADHFQDQLAEICVHNPAQSKKAS